ncbi:hypothetical protein HPT27_06960 [Permianibacter sp. IMCC34836]|uniref:hypothetical protein n=1 Tax=Permianibacter fluminis TaxID=2738515 RepID=UPI001554EFB9|nr:hypothetical protein [Permianibacter fluminis]NQD36761.1 hypothetical protein [Permianibacter fluminis]
MSDVLKLILVLALTVGPVQSAEPINDIAEFERRALDCFKDKEKVEKCFRQSIKPHLSPSIADSDSESLASKIQPIFIQMSGSDQIYSIHKAKHKVIEGLFDDRAYAIELTTDGAFILLEMSFISIKGKWYIHKFNISNRDESFKSTLDVGW